jgi:hypothetical protein
MKRRHWANEHVDRYEDDPGIRDHLLGSHERAVAEWANDISDMDLETLNDQHAFVHGIFDAAIDLCAWCGKTNPNIGRFCSRKSCLESRAYAENRPYQL